MQKGDPDGTGAKDLIPFSAPGKTLRAAGQGDLADFVFYAYGRPYGDWALNANGEVVPHFEHASFKEGMGYLKKLWDERLIDREYQQYDLTKLEEKFFQGKNGIAVEYMFRHVSRIENALKKVNPKAELLVLDAPTGPSGKRAMGAASRSFLCMFVTSASKTPNKAAEWLEFMVSDSGKNLLRQGIEGVHYTKQGDKITYNEDERAKDGFSPNGWAHPLAWGSAYWPLDDQYLPETEPQRDRGLQSIKMSPLAPNLFPLLTPIEVEHGAVLDDIYIQAFTDILSGKVAIDAGVTELGRKWRSQGGDKVLVSLNDQYKKMKR